MNKSKPSPYVPGNTDGESMDSAGRKMFSVSKEAVRKQEAKKSASGREAGCE